MAFPLPSKFKSFVEVKQASGQDLLETWDAYSLERTLVLSKGTHILPDILSIPNAASGDARWIHLKGKGADTIIVGSAALADESLIKSLQSSWVGVDAFPRLILENISLKGSGVEHYIIDGSCMLIHGIGSVRLGGTLRAAADGIGIYTYGSGPPAEPSGFDTLYIFPSAGAWLTGLSVRAENFAAKQIIPIAGSGGITTGVSVTPNFFIGNISTYLGSGKNMTRILNATGRGVVGYMGLAFSSGYTVLPYMIKAIHPVKISHIAMKPFSARYTIGEDDNTMKLINVDNWECEVLYSSGGITKTDPNTTYVLWDAAYDFSVDLSHWKYAKLVMDDGRSNEATAGKGIALYNSTNAVNLCEVTWDGVVSSTTPHIGNWVDLVALGAAGTGIKALRLYVKGSSATEDITAVYGINLYLSGWRYA